MFDGIKRKKIKYGVVPAENVFEGFIGETFDNLINEGVCVLTSFSVPIHHNLISKERSLDRINKIISHPQAIAQCRKWLKKHTPDVEIVFSSSTAKINEVEGVGYIGSKDVASKYNMNVLSENIEDFKGNKTEFYVISSKQYDRHSMNFNPRHTMFVMSVYDRVGILRDLLGVFGDRGINLSKIFSRPSRLKEWDYFFFIEAEIPPDNRIIKNILTELRKYCPFIKVTGGVKEK